MDVRHLLPCVKVAADSVHPVPWAVKGQVAAGYEVLYVKEGELAVAAEGRCYRGLPGDLFLFRPGQCYSLRSVSKQNIRRLSLQFSLDPGSRFGEEGQPTPLGSLPVRIQPREPAILERMLLDIIHECDQRMVYYEMKVVGMMIDLLVCLIRERHWQQFPHVRINREVLLKVQQYLYVRADSHVTLDELAGTFCFSKFYLNRMFRSAFRVSPMQYHQQIRLEKAKQAIQMTDQPLARIAQQFGYPNVHAFSRSFKKQQGVPPSHYRTGKKGESAEAKHREGFSHSE